MHIVVTLDIEDAEPKVLAEAIALAKAVADAEEKSKAAQPSAMNIKEGSIEPLTKTQQKALEAVRKVPVQAPGEEPKPATTAEDDSFTDGDGIGQTFSPDAETPAEPEPESAAAESSITLDELRRRFTAISKEHPGARKKVSEILVAAGARSLPTLPEDKYEWALDELESWAKEQSA